MSKKTRKKMLRRRNPRNKMLSTGVSRNLGSATKNQLDWLQV